MYQIDFNYPIHIYFVGIGCIQYQLAWWSYVKKAFRFPVPIQAS